MHGMLSAAVLIATFVLVAAAAASVTVALYRGVGDRSHRCDGGRSAAEAGPAAPAGTEPAADAAHAADEVSTGPGSVPAVE